jgi:hypothetical protein
MSTKFHLETMSEPTMCLDGRMVLKRTLNEENVKLRTGFTWLVRGPVADSYGHCNEPSSYVKAENCFIS